MIRTLKDVPLGEATDFRVFLDCQLQYYQKYLDARDKFLVAKERLTSSTQGLVCHPEVSEKFKSHLLRLLKTL